ncbi:MAG: transcription antitermination factor NusB [Alphaproteobacteria bacterium]|nr:transcription antitermination factor NusB [Alphaproteobacteria bacterium]MCL2505990.1 transcription antitermination factor NusB [Alphaproteobacteria bacterium]
MRNEELKKFSAKTLARLAAVQALYRVSVSGEDILDVIKQFIKNPEVLLEETRTVMDIDTELFSLIVKGVEKNKADIDSMIEGAASNKTQAKRFELLLKTILRAGIFEFMENQSVPKDIIINDYMEITHSFFNAKEPALVNAVLDNIGKRM